MTNRKGDILFEEIRSIDAEVFELLLLADPSKSLVEAYLKQSEVYTASLNGKLQGVKVLYPLSLKTVEIKNVAVKPDLQGQGIGTYLIERSIEIASISGKLSICIGTSNTSVGQLYLYQKLGFEITDIKRNFFIDNYSEPIFENGIQAKHMLILTRQLNDERKN